MKTGSILVLVALVISVIIPHVAVVHAANSNQPALITLDVCGQHGSAVASGVDMPSIHECISCIAPLPLMSSYIHLNPEFIPFVSVFRDERPPRV